MADPPALIQRSAGGGERYNVGQGYKIGALASVEHVRRELAIIARKAALGQLELEGARALTRILKEVLGAIHTQRKHDLESRRLDLLGAAAEEGVIFFQGIAIVPPPGYDKAPDKPVVTIDPAQVTVAEKPLPETEAEPIGVQPDARPKRKTRSRKKPAKARTGIEITGPKRRK